MEKEEIVEETEVVDIAGEDSSINDEEVVASGEVATLKKKKKRIPLKHRTSKNDINYRGPLSYRSLRIIAWVFMIIAQVTIIMEFSMTVSKDLVPVLSTATTVLSYAQNFPLPLFLLANFAFILQKKDNFRKLFIFYGGISLTLYAAAILVVTHFGMGFIYNMSPDEFDFGFISVVLGTAFASSSRAFLYVFNLFIDLFLCTLTYFFIHYQPKRYFAGKKIVFFRLMVLLPICYELGSLAIKHYVGTGELEISYFLFFLLTAKPPFMFVAFLLIVLFIKIQKMSFMKKFHDEKLLDNHLETNAHSLKVSITIFWVFLLCVFLDILAMIIYVFYNIYPYITESEDVILEKMIAAFYNVTALGLGGSFPLFFIAPLALLFSYTKRPKNPKVDTFIPLVAVVLIVLVYIEGVFRIASSKFSDFISWLANLIGAE